MSEATTSPNPVRLLTVREVCEIVREKPHSVYRRVRLNQIGGVVRMGQSLRFDPVALDKWIREGGTGV